MFAATFGLILFRQFGAWHSAPPGLNSSILRVTVQPIRSRISDGLTNERTGFNMV